MSSDPRWLRVVRLARGLLPGVEPSHADLFLLQFVR